MNNKIYCSTGTMIGKVNDYDYKLIIQYYHEIYADAFELMMLKFWYDKLNKIANDFNKSKCNFPVIHAEKDIGTLLSQNKEGDTEEAIRLFEINCQMGNNIGSEKIVLHLWGGLDSDSHIDHNVMVCEKMLEIASKYNIILMIENIPCTTQDPLVHWTKLNNLYPEIKFIFDTRFGAFHQQIDEICSTKWLWNNKIIHMHISDYGGQPLEFSKIRPILHPGEGVIDFQHLFKNSNIISYDNSITLESPVMSENGIDIVKLNQSLSAIKNFLERRY